MSATGQPTVGSYARRDGEAILCSVQVQAQPQSQEPGEYVCVSTVWQHPEAHTAHARLRPPQKMGRAHTIDELVNNEHNARIKAAAQQAAEEKQAAECTFKPKTSTTPEVRHCQQLSRHTRLTSTLCCLVCRRFGHTVSERVVDKHD